MIGYILKLIGFGMLCITVVAIFAPLALSMTNYLLLFGFCGGILCVLGRLIESAPIRKS